MGHNVKTTWGGGGGGGAWGKFNDQTEPIVLSQVSSSPYQGTYQMQKQSVLFQFQSKIL